MRAALAIDAGTQAPTRPGTGWEARLLMGTVVVLFGFGVLILYSASAFMAAGSGSGHTHALRQLGGGLAGLAVMMVLARLDYRMLRRLAWPVLGCTLLLLLLVILPWTEAMAPRINGARRWLDLGVMVQASEVAKLAVVVWTAALAVKKQERLHSLRKGLLPFLIVWAVVIALVSLQPDFSAALTLALLSALVLFAGGARIGHFVLLALIGMPVVWLLIQGASYRVGRVAAFLDPASDPAGIGYQVHQSLVAIGSGGIYGVGFGESRQKFGFLPEPHNDFIFSMIAEELGLLGVLGLLAFFGTIGWLGHRIAHRAPDMFGYLLSVGMTQIIVLAALLHMGVALALVPATGVTLPFVSYGRSALVVCFAAVGILLSVARVTRKLEAS